MLSHLKKGKTLLCHKRERTRRATNLERTKAQRYTVCDQRVWFSTHNLPLQSISCKLAPRFIIPLSKILVLLQYNSDYLVICNTSIFHVSCIKLVIRAPSCPTFSPVLEVTSIWSTGRGKVWRREARFQPRTSWMLSFPLWVILHPGSSYLLRAFFFTLLNVSVLYFMSNIYIELITSITIL